jgi:hypothetical protein
MGFLWGFRRVCFRLLGICANLPSGQVVRCNFCGIEFMKYECTWLVLT